MMNAISRPELDAKLKTVDVRMDSINEKLDRIASGMTSLDATMSNLKTTTIVTGISSVLAMLLGLGAINATLLSNMVASFESGKNTAAAQAEVRRQAEATATLLKQVQEQLNSRPVQKK